MEKLYPIVCSILLGATSAFPANALRFKPQAKAADEAVYNIQGIKVLDAENADQISTLPAGIYITCGKKFIKK